jgi:hypothetical protein
VELEEATTMSSFKSVLSKIGHVLLTAGSVATELMGFPFLGTLLGATPTGRIVEIGLGDLGKVAQIVSQVEVGFQAIGPGDTTGSLKLKAAVPMVKQVVLAWAQSNLPGHDKLKSDAQTFDNHVAAFTSSFVDILNDFGE